MARNPESAGRRLKRAVLKDFELDAGELVMLEQAANLADVCARLDAEVAKSPLTTRGSKGQKVASPLLLQQRKHAERLQRLLEALKLPAKGEQEGRSAAARKAQAAAQARWRQQRGRMGNGPVA